MELRPSRFQQIVSDARRDTGGGSNAVNGPDPAAEQQRQAELPILIFRVPLSCLREIPKPSGPPVDHKRGSRLPGIKTLDSAIRAELLRAGLYQHRMDDFKTSRSAPMTLRVSSDFVAGEPPVVHSPPRHRSHTRQPFKHLTAPPPPPLSRPPSPNKNLQTYVSFPHLMSKESS